MKIIENLDGTEFQNYLSSTGNTICGRHPITLFLSIIEKTNLKYHLKFIKYAQSSSVLSANDSSVSYASAIVEHTLG